MENSFLTEDHLIDTSFLLNPFFFQGSDYWDKPGWQMPVNGAYQPYDPQNDPGFNQFDVSYGFITVKSEETVQQRILLSPGINVIHGKYSQYDPGSGQWSPLKDFEEVILNTSDMHLMEIFTLEAMDNKKTRYAGLIPRCLTPKVYPSQLKERVKAELGTILSLHKNTFVYLDPPPETAFGYIGIHTAGKYKDCNDLGSYEALLQSMSVPSPQAQLYLSAAQSGLTAYNGMAYAYALGGLSTLCTHGSYLLPYRYQFADQQWTAPEVGQAVPLSNLLSYLCDCAELSKEIDFFIAAYKVAEEMIQNNWWDLNADPEGLYFLSNRFSLNASGLLRGWAIMRTPLSSPGASVYVDSDDHRLLLGAAAVSKFLRVFHENEAIVGAALCNTDLMTQCYVAIEKSLQSFCVYADRFDLSWVDNMTAQNMLTTGWWTNFDRRDDFAGYNIGEGMMKIFLDQCRIFGYGSLQNKYWVQRMFAYLDAYQALWEENTVRGGKEASDSFRFYQSFCDVRAVEECKAWSDQYLAMYICGLMQIYKGFMNNGYPPQIGTWEISDWEPSQSVFSKEVTVPGTLFSWAADIYEISRDNQGDVQWLSTMLDIMLDLIQRTAKGEAGYVKDMSISGDMENGGEFRLAVGLFDLLDA
ncbi:MAG: hypothetical protein ABIK28_15150, partial [Planctomycetota bacterium]